jgi:integration host factor subunit beta
MGRNQKQLADTIAKEMKLTIREGRHFVTRLLELIQEDLVKTGRSEFRGLGTFAVFTRPPRNTTHPVTGEPVHIPERRAVRYRTSKELKEALNAPQPKKRRKSRGEG